VARLLVEAGERPAILSRGYARRSPVEGVVVVSDGQHRLADLDRSGDEPLMLARHVPGAAVLVCKTRALAAAVAERELGATVHVLDDGFQHRSLARDLDIVIISPGDLSDRRLPFGRLRSPVTALRTASAVIVDGVVDTAVEARLSALVDQARTQVFALTRSLGTPWWLEPRSAPVPQGARVVALAAIARPERFTAALTHAGWIVAEAVNFRDHHAFTRRDIARVAGALARTSATAVLTTEKDAMRLLPMRPIGLPVAAVPLTVAVEPAAAFREWLITRVGEVRRCA
jgi:tetraacyldisaccharide 4'-kinase